MADDAAPSPAQVLARAEVLAAEVLGPAVMAVEASQRIPAGHLDRLAAEGFYGLAGPREAGGLDLPLPVAGQVVETLARTPACPPRSSGSSSTARIPPTARAAACGLAMRRRRRRGAARRRAPALVVARGAAAILASQDAQRLAREALFLLVFGSRPTIKQALAGLLTGDHTEGAAWRNR